MHAKTVFMFSGQGSHYFQMGRALFERHPVFQRHMRLLDDLVRELSGQSVLATLYAPENAKGETFDRTSLTHPAIFMVEYSLAQALISAGVLPELTLGTSLGSFAAAAVAGVIKATDALAAIVRQASALEQFCEPGGMLAVLADPSLYREDLASRQCELAAVNYSTHFVVAARLTQCAAIEAALTARNISWLRLPVSFAFHSRWIDGARNDFESFMQSVRLDRGRLPVVCCDQAAILEELPHGHFWGVARNPIRFPQAVAALERAGTYRYIDVGPAGTLATFLKYGLPPASVSSAHPILTPFGRDLQNWGAVTGRPL